MHDNPAAVPGPWGLLTCVERLAIGGGGTVWLARLPGESEARFVVKEPAAGLERALHGEWRALLDVPSPVLPEPVAWLAATGDLPPALAMRRRLGVPLDQALAGATPARVAAVMQALLRGLQALHAAGLVHGDLHPGNVLVAGAEAATGPVRVALLDLGLAVATGAQVIGPGRLQFAAPDTLRGLTADPRDDLFTAALAVWTAWRLPAPFAHYPAVLPSRTDLPQLPPAGDPARDTVVRLLAACLAPAREHRPDHAEQALRQWTSALHTEADEADALADDLQALAYRPWRWGRWPGSAALPTLKAGEITWLHGEPGSGRTGALTALTDAATVAGRRVAWVLPGADPIAGAWASLRLIEAHVKQDVATGPSALADAAGDQVARQAGRLDALCAALEPQGLLAIDDADLLPAALQRALATLEPVSISVVAATRTPHAGWQRRPSAVAGTWSVPPADATELAAFLQAASGGRTWHAGLVAHLAAQAISRRDACLLAAACLRHRLVEVTAEHVALPPDRDAQAVLAPLLAARAAHCLPEAALWPALAQVTFAGREGAVLPGADLLRDVAMVRVTTEGRVAVADEAVRAFLLANLPATLLAGAARQRASELADDDPQRIAWLVAAADWAGGALPDASSVHAAAAIWLAQAETARAIELCSTWLGRAGDGAHAAVVIADLVRGLVARGRFDDAEARLAAVSPDVRTGTPLLLAEAELAFRRGDYPRSRECAQAVLAGGESGVAADAWVWLGFAATWQGDRAVAADAVQHGRRLATLPGHVQLLDYLAALGDYYAGRLEPARTAFTELAARSTGTLRAAAEGGLGLVAHRNGELLVARAHYDTARRLAEAAGDLPRALNMAMNAAVLDHEHGDLGRALDGYDRVVLSAQQLDNQGALARALDNRGNLLALLGDDRAARADLDHALAVMQRTGNAYLEGNVRCVMAELDRREGRLDDASGQLDRAEAALVGAESERLEIRLERGQLQLAAGDVPAARATALEVRVASARLGGAETEARALWLLARTRLDSPTVPNGDALGEALAHLDAATHLAPPSKALLHVQLLADRARTLVLQSDFPGARLSAREGMARLVTVAGTLGPEPQRRFEHAPVLAPVRTLLRLLAALPDGGRGNLLAGTTGAGALHAVLTINHRLSGEHDLPHLLELVMDSAVLLTGAERAFLLLDEEEDGARKPPRLRVAVARNLDRENLKKPQHKLSHSIALKVFASGDPVLSTDAQQDERFAEHASIHAASLRSILCVPLSCQGRPIGVLYVDNRFATGAFSADHAGVLAALADQAAIAIQTARLIERQRRTAEDLARSQAEVQQLNAQLRVQLAATEHALDDARADLQDQRLALARRSDFSQIKGESPKLHRLFALMERVRDHDFPVLVRGESGTGKELVARAIHFTGRRRKGPFVAVNCAALPPNLLESELFGHVRGAFTGAVADRRGLFEAANGGTLLLDEIGEMPLEMQTKLLRVLQTSEIQRVGDSTIRKVDARIVTATHRDLQAMTTQGTFREDLLYRLRVVELEIPPLRQREEDIPMLVEHFLAENRAAGVGRVERIAPAALQKLRQYPWPGNVRQLEMMLKSACLFADGAVLQLADVEPLLHKGKSPDVHENEAEPDWLMTATLDDVITRVVQGRVDALAGNKRRAAESLGIDRGTLYNRLKS